MRASMPEGLNFVGRNVNRGGRKTGFEWPKYRPNLRGLIEFPFGKYLNLYRYQVDSLFWQSLNSRRHSFCYIFPFMGIRIDHIRSESETVVHIAGRLSGTAIGQLKKTCDPIEGPIVIDLSSLLFADEEGINTIRAIIDRGAQVHGASPFVALLLDKTQDEKPLVKHQGQSVRF